jgi:predicted small lipoprotein YifL
MHKSRNNTFIKVITAGCLLTLSVGCGQRGALYLPKEELKKEVTAKPTTQPKENEQKGS